MSFAETAALGAIAGFTIYIGLPLGRMERVGVRLRVGLAMFSVGAVSLKKKEVATHAEGIVARALHTIKDPTAGALPAACTR
jgi:ZIP family zinc transporter